MKNSRSLAEMFGAAVRSAHADRISMLTMFGCSAGAGDYIPSSDIDFADWVANFKTQLALLTTFVGVTTLQNTTFAGLATTWATAYALTVNPATRTSLTIADKVTQRGIVEPAARNLVNIIQAFPATTDLQRTQLALNMIDTPSTQIPAPSTKPVVNVEDIQNLAHLLRLRDELTPTSNAKPAGALSCEIWRKIGPGEPLSIADCAYQGDTTRRFFTSVLDPGDVGKTAYYIARWKNAKGETGPTSDQVSATIAA